MHRWHPSVGVHLKKEKNFKAEFKAQTGFYRGVTKSGHWVYMVCITELLIHLKQLKPVTKTKKDISMNTANTGKDVYRNNKKPLKWAVTYLKFTHYNSAHSSCKSQHTAWTWLVQFKGTVFGGRKKKQVLADTQHGMNCILATKVNNVHSAGIGPTEAAILRFLIKGKSENCRKITTHIAS